MLTFFHFKLKKDYGLLFSFRNSDIAINFENPPLYYFYKLNWETPPPCNLVMNGEDPSPHPILRNIRIYIHTYYEGPN